MFTLRDAIFLIELAFYCPIPPIIIFILLIHGGKKPYTWRPILIPLFLLSGLRIASASLGLAAINPDKSNLLSTATLLDTIGLAPILCLLIGVLVRANAPLRKGLSIWIFLPLQLTIIAATIMTAYGGRDLYTTDQHQTKDLTLMRAGICLSIAIFAITVLLSVITLFKVQGGYGNERAAAVCAVLSIPFMSVRLAFSAGSLFSGEGSVLDPMAEDDTGVWLHLFMVVVMEYVVVLSATAVALGSRRVVLVEKKEEDGFDKEIEVQTWI